MKLEGIPRISGGKQVTTFGADQLSSTLLPEGYSALVVTVTDPGESIADVVAVLGFVFPGQALVMTEDGKSVSFAPEAKVTEAKLTLTQSGKRK